MNIPLKSGKFREIKKIVVILWEKSEVILLILILIFINTLFIVHFAVVVAGFFYSDI